MRRARHRRALVAAALGCAAVLAAAPAAAQPAARLVITGSSTMAPLVADLAERFRARQPRIAITVESGGSARGALDALSGKADLGMVSRALTPEESDLFAIPIARDGVSFVVHAENPVKGLTREQARGIYAGDITDWKALGGRAAPIDVVTRPPGRSSLEIVSHYLGMRPQSFNAARAIGENKDLIDYIASHPDAIGYVSIGETEDAAQKGKRLKALALDGVAPATASVQQGLWPLSRPLNLVSRKVPSGAAKDFVEFTLSPDAREAIVAHDFVPYRR